MLKVGDIITTRNIRHYVPKGWLEYKAEKNKNMVFLYIGQEPKNQSSPINFIKAIEKLGFIREK